VVCVVPFNRLGTATFCLVNGRCEEVGFVRTFTFVNGHSKTFMMPDDHHQTSKCYLRGVNSLGFLRHEAKYF
jgi:hypothetical protein